MPDLSFQIEDVQPLSHAVSPTLALKLRVSNAGQEPIHNVMLRCQIQIEATRRRYDDDEQARLYDLFGEPERWGRTLGTVLWTHTSVIVPAFTGSTMVDLLVPCTYDFNIAATKYFDALENGEIPLCLLFSGTIFYQGAAAPLQVAQISWEKEAKFRLSVQVWKSMMHAYYPNSAWLRLRKDVFDRLREHKSQCGLPSWEAAVEDLMAGNGTRSHADHAEERG